MQKNENQRSLSQHNFQWRRNCKDITCPKKENEKCIFEL